MGRKMGWFAFELNTKSRARVERTADGEKKTSLGERGKSPFQKYSHSIGSTVMG